MRHTAWMSAIARWHCIVLTGHVQLSLQLSALFDMFRVLQFPSLLDDCCFASGM